jgi:hypothetical protein
MKRAMKKRMSKLRRSLEGDYINLHINLSLLVLFLLRE